MRPTIRQLEYAVAVAEEESFSRAAARCFVSQPSLSTQIRQLELQLGVELFERTPRGTLLTAAGRKVVDLAREVLEASDRIVAQARASGAPLDGEVRLGSVSTITPYLLPRALVDLRDRFPAASLIVQDDTADRLKTRLVDGAIDCLLVPLPTGLSGVEEVELVRDPFVVAAPRGAPIARLPDPLAIEALKDKEVLLLEDPHCLRGHALQLCDRAHAAPHHSLYATSLSAIVQLVKRGLGITLLPAISIEVEVAVPSEIVLKPFAAPAPGRTLGLVWRKGSPRSEEFGILASILMRHAEAAMRWEELGAER